jgi:peroxiredoxin
VLVAGLLAMVDGVAEAGDPLFQAMRVAHVNGDVEAPAFALPATDGKSVALAELRGHVVLLNFWATWCAPCREEMPSMERLYQAFKDRRLAVLAVNLQESPKQVARFMRDFRLTFPALLDADLAVAGRYQVRGLPATFLIDRQGRIVGQALGARDWSSAPAQALVGSLLPAQAARP